MTFIEARNCIKAMLGIKNATYSAAEKARILTELIKSDFRPQDKLHLLNTVLYKGGANLGMSLFFETGEDRNKLLNLYFTLLTQIVNDGASYADVCDLLGHPANAITPNTYTNFCLWLGEYGTHEPIQRFFQLLEQLSHKDEAHLGRIFGLFDEDGIWYRPTDNSKPESTFFKCVKDRNIDISLLRRIIKDCIAKQVNFKDIQNNPIALYSQLKISKTRFSSSDISLLLKYLPQQYYDEDLRQLETFLDLMSKRENLEYSVESMMKFAVSITEETSAETILEYCSTLLTKFQACPVDFPTAATENELRDSAAVSLACMIGILWAEYQKLSDDVYLKQINNKNEESKNNDQNNQTIMCVMLNRFIEGSMSSHACTQFYENLFLDQKLLVTSSTNTWWVGNAYTYLLTRMPESHPFYYRIYNLFFSQLKTLLQRQLESYKDPKYADLITKIQQSLKLDEILNHLKTHLEQAPFGLASILNIFSNNNDTKFIQSMYSIIKSILDARMKFNHTPAPSPATSTSAVSASELSAKASSETKLIVSVKLSPAIPPLLPPAASRENATNPTENSSSVAPAVVAPSVSQLDDLKWLPVDGDASPRLGSSANASVSTKPNTSIIPNTAINPNESSSLATLPNSHATLNTADTVDLLGLHTPPAVINDEKKPGVLTNEEHDLMCLRPPADGPTHHSDAKPTTGLFMSAGANAELDLFGIYPSTSTVSTENSKIQNDATSDQETNSDRGASVLISKMPMLDSPVFSKTATTTAPSVSSGITPPPAPIVKNTFTSSGSASVSPESTHESTVVTAKVNAAKKTNNTTEKRDTASSRPGLALA